MVNVSIANGRSHTLCAVASSEISHWNNIRHSLTRRETKWSEWMRRIKTMNVLPAVSLGEKKEELKQRNDAAKSLQVCVRLQTGAQRSSGPRLY